MGSKRLMMQWFGLPIDCPFHSRPICSPRVVDLHSIIKSTEVREKLRYNFVEKGHDLCGCIYTGPWYKGKPHGDKWVTEIFVFFYILPDMVAMETMIVGVTHMGKLFDWSTFKTTGEQKHSLHMLCILEIHRMQ